MSNIPSDVGDLLLASAQATSRWRGLIKFVVVAVLLLIAQAFKFSLVMMQQYQFGVNDHLFLVCFSEMLPID